MRMWQFPNRRELVLFAVVAVVGAGLSILWPKIDLGMSAMAFPVFVGAALMGMRHKPSTSSMSEPGGARRAEGADARK
jgi:hypothetical protein